MGTTTKGGVSSLWLNQPAAKPESQSLQPQPGQGSDADSDGCLAKVRKTLEASGLVEFIASSGGWRLSLLRSPVSVFQVRKQDDIQDALQSMSCMELILHLEARGWTCGMCYKTRLDKRAKFKQASDMGPELQTLGGARVVAGASDADSVLDDIRFWAVYSRPEHAIREAKALVPQT